MKGFKTLCKYFCYCGISKDEYNAVKREAYISNFIIWRILHFFMAALFGALFIISLFNNLLTTNKIFYFSAFIYSLIAILLFFILRKDSIIAQFIIYLSISLLFLLGGFITKNNPYDSATTFIALLLITPMFMIDKPYFMALELSAVSTLLLVWMYYVKPYEVWIVDLINVIIFTIVGIFLNVIANSIRIREFVLTRKINIQKDIDDLTGLKNKGALTREINKFLADSSKDKGLMFMMDIDHFKSINDTFGHDVGDEVITQLGHFIGSISINDEIIGRFGGDEFILFIKNTDDVETAKRIADQIVIGASEHVALPDTSEKISVSIGIAIYKGIENNYSEIFKKADIALYKAKGDSSNRFCFY